jgi:thiamine-monophosphate kinase
VDVSDGLVADLGHVARASGVKIVLDAATIPRSAALRAFWGDEVAAIIRAATAGDDYQIAFTAADHDGVMTAAREAGVMVTRIGAVQVGDGVEMLLEGRPLDLPRTGYRHF